MRNRIRSWFLAVTGAVLVQVGLPTAGTAWAGVPGSTSQINVDAHGLALGGYDPVAYYDKGTPTRGSDKISASYEGVRYLFTTAAHRRAFLKNPSAYIPEFGGFCVVGAAYGQKVDVDPQTGKVVNGHLYLNNSAKALEIFDKDPAGTIRKAETKWPTVKDEAL
jgi:YHS domain-containing protein